MAKQTRVGGRGRKVGAGRGVAPWGWLGLGLVALGGGALGCGSGGEGDGAGDDATVQSVASGAEGLHMEAGKLVFRTAEFQLAAKEEKFLCYAHTLEQSVQIDRFIYGANPAVHHFVFAKTSSPEPDGLHECNVLFRNSWQPLFGAGTSGVELALPEGAGQILKPGDQILIQLHLLNLTDEPIEAQAAVQMRTSERDDLTPVGLYTIGNADIALPPGERSTVTAVCHVPEDVEVFAAIPHMHYLGTKLRLELGESMDTLETVFERDPYDFDDQRVEPLELSIAAGQYLRVTCEFDNDREYVVGFGESSRDEMCYFVGFALGFTGFNPCPIEGLEVREVPRDPAAGECGEHSANELGVGSACTPGGGECPAPLSCTADLSEEAGDEGLCMKLGCKSHDECGGGDAVCCTPTQGGGAVNICYHEACRELSCAPL